MTRWILLVTVVFLSACHTGIDPDGPHASILLMENITVDLTKTNDVVKTAPDKVSAQADSIFLNIELINQVLKSLNNPEFKHADQIKKRTLLKINPNGLIEINLYMKNKTFACQFLDSIVILGLDNLNKMKMKEKEQQELIYQNQRDSCQNQLNILEKKYKEEADGQKRMEIYDHILTGMEQMNKLIELHTESYLKEVGFKANAANYYIVHKAIWVERGK